MSESLVAHRFQTLVPLRAGRVARLDVARDVASDVLGTLLTVPTTRPELTEHIVRVRLASLGEGLLFRHHAPQAALEADGVSLFFLPPIEAHPWESQLLAADGSAALADLRTIQRGLAEHLARGCPAGALSLDSLFSDEQGPFFLPDAYACAPLTATAGVPADSHRDPAACAQEIRGFRDELVGLCRRYLKMASARLAAEQRAALEDAVAELLAEMPDRPIAAGLEGLLEALEALREEGGTVLLAANAQTRHQALEAVRGWAQTSERRCVRLRPHLGPPMAQLKLPAEDGGGAVAILDGYGTHARFVEGLGRLANSGWIDGREILVVAMEDAEPDAAGRLFLEQLRRRGEDRCLEPVLGPQKFDEAPGLPAGVEGMGLRVLEALTVTRRPLAASYLARTFSLPTSDVAEVAVELWRDRRVHLDYGRPDEVGEELQLLLSLPPGRTVLVSEERESEIRPFLASALEELEGRGGVGRGWLRVESALATEPEAAPSLGRQLAALATREHLPLLEYAVYERLLSEADRCRPTLEDRCQAALVMGEQHRRIGEFEEAARIFGEGLDALQESGEQIDKRLVPLAAELSLRTAALARDRNKFLEAHRILGEVLERFEEDLPAINRGRIYLDLAWALLKLGRTRESASYDELVLKILDAERYPEEVSRAYNQLGVVQYEESNYSQSLINLQRGLVLREQADDSIGVARSYNNLSLTYRSLGRLAEAERCLKRSLELKVKEGDSMGVAIAQLNLGLLAIDQGDYEQARRYAAECLHLARRNRHRQMEAEAHGLLGEAAMGEGRFEEARDLLLRDLEICRASNHETERLATLRRFVGLLLKLGALDEARRRLEEAKEVLAGVPSRYEAAMLSTFEAELASRAGEDEPAIAALVEASRSFGAMRRFDLQLDCLARRASLQLRRGQTNEARQSYLEARDLAARHEIHRMPELLHELEREMGEISPAATAGVSAVDHRLEALADLLAPGGDLEAGRLEGALRALAAGLAPEAVFWVRAPRERTLGLIQGEVRTGAPPSALADIVARAESDRVPASFREEEWAAVRVRGADVGWLVLKRGRPLDDGEFSFLQSVAGILSLSGGAAAPPVQRESLPEETPQPGAAFGIIGNGAEIRTTLRMIDMVKDNDVTILLLGENGTGKDLVARAVHQAGPRHKHELVAVNCASIPSTLLESELFGHEKGAFTSAVDRRVGIFERADGGTVFLDEIAEMPLAMQAKLLRVLQDKSFTRVGGGKTVSTDVRVVAATNRELSEEVEQGRFRMDLFYRLNVISIRLPPLRDRRDDIKPLVHHFLRKFGDEFRRPVRGITDEAIARLMEYDWPGNIRELENVIKKAIVFAGREILRVEDLPSMGAGVGPVRGRASVEENSRVLVDGQDYTAERPLMPRLELVLAHEMVQAVGNKTKAAQLLGITKPTLYNRLRRHAALYGEEGAEPEALGRRGRSRA